MNLKPEKEGSRCSLTAATDRAMGCTKHVPSIHVPCDRPQDGPTGGVGVPTLGVRRQRLRKVGAVQARAALRKEGASPGARPAQRGPLGGRRTADSRTGQDSEPKKSLCGCDCDLRQSGEQGREVSPEPELNALALCLSPVVSSHRHMVLGGRPRYPLGVT